MIEKNINAIDKIIATLSHRDWQSAINKLTKKQRDNIRYGKKVLGDYGGYTLGVDTNEAREIKLGYLLDKITEEEYKSYCLRWNLRNS